MQALAAAHWQAVQAAEHAAGAALVQAADYLSIYIGHAVVSGLAGPPIWCPQLVDSTLLALIHQKLSFMTAGEMASRRHSLWLACVGAVVPEGWQQAG
jgi:hypothetical protein